MLMTVTFGIYRQSIINECFSKDSVEKIIKSLVISLGIFILLHAESFLGSYIWLCFDLKEAEANKEGNGWIGAVLKGMKRSSPTALKIALRSVRIL